MKIRSFRTGIIGLILGFFVLALTFHGIWRHYNHALRKNDSVNLIEVIELDDYFTIFTSLVMIAIGVYMINKSQQKKIN